ncbi:MAG: BamA/TamA family outer membrane protein [Vicingaceae bacterium]|nr:BamA/TamA family outer membrane protein [Vicingaceae bacterium]
MKHKHLIIKPLSKTSYFLLFALCLITIGCSPTKHLKPNEIFLQKNKIKVSTGKLDNEELSSIVKQKTNRKILGAFRYHLGVFNFFNKKGTETYKEVGEPPVVYDSLQTIRTAKQLKLYANNKGYFDSQITYSSKIKNKKVKVIYDIEAGEPYRIRNIEYKIADKGIQDLIIEIILKSKLYKGGIYEVDLFESTREHIKTLMRDEGYYYFTKDYVKFKVDSSIGNKEIDVQMLISMQKVSSKEQDTLTLIPHKKYYINDINMYVSENFNEKNLFEFDTTSFKKTLIHYDGDLKYSPRMLNHTIAFKKEELYLLSEQKSTYKHLSELRLFKNVNISFEDIGENKLNANVFLTTAKKKSFSIEGIGTNSGGNLGVEGNLIYNNKNLFRGGEKFTIKLNGGLEAQQLINDEQEDFKFLGLPFNTFEIGPEFSLEFPRFLLPIKLDRFSRRANPKTKVTYLFNYQKRPEYTRNLNQATFGYLWNESLYKKHVINPINVSVINLNPSVDFQERLNDETNPFILNSFQNHFINSTSYSFIYNNQKINSRKDFQFLRFDIEVAGNIQHAFNRLSNKPYDNIETESYNVFNIRYAQFIKTDLDLRFYEQSKSTALVSRLNIGLGKPYGNLNVLPFEKSYFGGGANDIRAWQARSLGPGSIADSLTQNSLNQIGELKIEGNLEYRFDITKLFEGAAFIDAGNIWLLSADNERPNAEFKASRFWQDLAIGVGLGLRLDFNFFLIRFDLASKLKNPATETPEKLDLIWNKPTLNLGIGYPF